LTDPFRNDRHSIANFASIRSLTYEIILSYTPPVGKQYLINQLRLATLTMVIKLAMEAEKTWQRIRGHQMIGKIIEGIAFVNGQIMGKAA
jgi:hypothetical protein